MTVREVTVQAPPRQLAPIDESVVLPKSVTDAAARANSYYQPEPGPDAQPDPAAAQQLADGQPPAQPQPEPVQPAAPAQDQGTPQPAPQPDPYPVQAQVD